MALFPRSYITNDQSAFPSIFRLFDEFDQYTSSPERNNRQLKWFTPKFDVKEVKDAYELHGELPGIEQKDIEIEFTDASTLTIKGHTEHSYNEGAPPAGFIEGDVNKSAIESGRKTLKAVIEDESSGNTQLTTTPSSGKVSKKGSDSEEKFWVSERSIGEFSRSFSFPARVDQDAVKASMKNGILSVLVPKAKKSEARKITIS